MKALRWRTGWDWILWIGFEGSCFPSASELLRVSLTNAEVRTGLSNGALQNNLLPMISAAHSTGTRASDVGNKIHSGAVKYRSYLRIGLRHRC